MQHIIQFLLRFMSAEMIKELAANLLREVVEKTPTKADDKALAIGLKMYDNWNDPKHMVPLSLELIGVVAELTPSDIDDNILEAIQSQLKINTKPEQIK